jgi:hypothetical protein
MRKDSVVLFSHKNHVGVRSGSTLFEKNHIMAVLDCQFCQIRPFLKSICQFLVINMQKKSASHVTFWFNNCIFILLVVKTPSELIAVPFHLLLLGPPTHEKWAETLINMRQMQGRKGKSASLISFIYGFRMDEEEEEEDGKTANLGN